MMAKALLDPPTGDACDDLIRQVESLRSKISRKAAASGPVLAGLPPKRRTSAKNLLTYLALRSSDLRTLQDQLSRLGLSSLGRLEPHVMATINLVLHNLYRLDDRDSQIIDLVRARQSFDESEGLLESNTASLLGPDPSSRRVRIMVTLPTEAADDYLLIHQLLESGMNCVRINCAKDGAKEWAAMAEHLANAVRATGIECRLMMDLGGPKLRTGPMRPEPPVLKIRPVRARDGRIRRPARIWLAAGESELRTMGAADGNLVVDRLWLEKVRQGDRVRLRDMRDAKRTWRIVDVTGHGCWAEASKTSYIGNGTVLRLHGANGVHRSEVSGLPQQSSAIGVRKGDIILLTLSNEPGTPAVHADTGKLLRPGSIPLAIPEIYRDVNPGEPVLFDDGRIGGLIEKCTAGQIQVRITHTHRPIENLRSDRGVNFPDSALDLPALSDKDLEDLEFAARHADMIGLSFTNRAEDLQMLRKRMEALKKSDLGVVVKIETKRGFANLPSILLEALKFDACGVMIARGDLAVECGFERMAELQEEILWICEAAHVPVIWATQVLENLTRRGYASRAEITDAAMGQGAEAVMLNKGPHIIEAVRTLDDILQRMQGHHNKKRSVMRQLNLACDFLI